MPSIVDDPSRRYERRNRFFMRAAEGNPDVDLPGRLNLTCAQAQISRLRLAPVENP